MIKKFSGNNMPLILLVFVCLHFVSCEKTKLDSPAGNTGNNGNNGNSVAPTVTNPDTYFIDVYQTFSGVGGWWVQEFTINTTTSFVLRGASTYAADFAVVPVAQLANFKNNLGFSGYGVMDNQFGTQYITLAPGTYYVGVRNQVSGTNGARVELDKRISLPASDKATYVDLYFSAAKNVSPNGGWVSQPFTVQSGYRYFMDGCNSDDVEYWVIPQSELSKFTAGQTFQYYTDYHALSTAEPGQHEMKLPAGNYAYVFRNSGTKAQALTYACERWKVN